MVGSNDEQMDGCIDRTIDGSMNVWNNGEIHVHVDGWMNRKIK